ncbi:hypothetical protein MTO96_013868 [Rhipicephalus appendiculatus]
MPEGSDRGHAACTSGGGGGPRAPGVCDRAELPRKTAPSAEADPVQGGRSLARSKDPPSRTSSPANGGGAFALAAPSCQTPQNEAERTWRKKKGPTLHQKGGAPDFACRRFPPCSSDRAVCAVF